jgi:hypothetical protein
MTQETPAKVFSLLGTALFSMAFLFAVTLSNASFTQVYNPLPNPLAPANVMAMVDNVSHDYAMFVQTDLVNPGQQSYAMAADNIAFIGQNAGPQLMSMTGISGLLSLRTQ